MWTGVESGGEKERGKEWSILPNAGHIVGCNCCEVVGESDGMERTGGVWGRLCRGKGDP